MIQLVAEFISPKLTAHPSKLHLEKKTDEFIHTVCFVSVNCMGVKWRSDMRAMR